MVYLRTILTIPIFIIAINNVLVEAGKATENRKRNLSKRASIHENTLKPHEHILKSMDEPVVEQLTTVTYIILDHILDDEQFQSYLNNLFSTLEQYAIGQIESKVEKLENSFTEWENQNFPDQTKKEKTREILIKNGIIKTTVNKEKKIKNKSSSKKE